VIIKLRISFADSRFTIVCAYIGVRCFQVIFASPIIDIAIEFYSGWNQFKLPVWGFKNTPFSMTLGIFSTTLADITEESIKFLCNIMYRLHILRLANRRGETGSGLRFAILSR